MPHILNKKSSEHTCQVVENKYQPGVPEKEALQDWDLREVSIG